MGYLKIKIALKPENIPKETLEEALIEGTRLEQKELNFQEIQILIQQILNKLNSVNSILSQTALQKMKNANVSSLNRDLKLELYSEFKKMENVEIYMQNAYLLIQQLREYFLKETIGYNYAIKYYGTTYSFNLTLEQIMSLKSIGQQFNFKGNKDNLMKLRFDKQGKLATLRDILDVLQKDNLSEFAVTDTLYEDIRNKYPDENEGNLYEAYLVFKNRFGDKYSYLGQKYQNVFNKILTSTKSNLISSTQGADIVNNNIFTSVKSYIKSAPSLINIQQLIQVLTKLQSAFDSYNNNKNSKQLAQEIVNLYTKDLTTRAHKAAVEKAEKVIEELLGNLKISK